MDEHAVKFWKINHKNAKVEKFEYTDQDGNKSSLQFPVLVEANPDLKDAGLNANILAFHAKSQQETEAAMNIRFMSVDLAMSVITKIKKITTQNSKSK